MSQDNTCTLSCHHNNDGHCISWAKVELCRRWRESQPLENATTAMTESDSPLARTLSALADKAPAHDYAILGHQIGELVTKKQAAYGDAFGKAGDVMRILYPGGISLEKMDDALTVVRVLDKLFRIATDRDALGESPWRDVAGYALLSVARVEGI